jgi:8-oxo-dGTP pyrophosphatase MutT (NUDIX family)
MSEYFRELRTLIGPRLILIPGVVAIIHDEAGRILLERRPGGGWGPTGGAIEPGETPARTLVREVFEETGLRVVPERVIAVLGGSMMRFVYPNGHEAEYTLIVFACRIIGGQLHPQQDEVLDLRYFDPADLPPLHLPYPPELFRLNSGPATWFHAPG